MIKKLRITIEGKSYDVTVETDDVPSSVRPAGVSQAAPVASAAPPASAPPAASSPASAPPPAASGGGVLSPLAAVVVSVDVSPGAKVTAGQRLLTLEAMKMNTYVQAPSDGEVGAIHVSAGDAVEEGQQLLQIR